MYSTDYEQTSANDVHERKTSSILHRKATSHRPSALLWEPWPQPTDTTAGRHRWAGSGKGVSLFIPTFFPLPFGNKFISCICESVSVLHIHLFVWRKTLKKDISLSDTKRVLVFIPPGKNIKTWSPSSLISAEEGNQHTSSPRYCIFTSFKL